MLLAWVAYYESLRLYIEADAVATFLDLPRPFARLDHRLEGKTGRFLSQKEELSGAGERLGTVRIRPGRACRKKLAAIAESLRGKIDTLTFLAMERDDAAKEQHSGGEWAMRLLPYRLDYLRNRIRDSYDDSGYLKRQTRADVMDVLRPGNVTDHDRTLHRVDAVIRTAMTEIAIGRFHDRHIPELLKSADRFRERLDSRITFAVGSDMARWERTRERLSSVKKIIDDARYQRVVMSRSDIAFSESLHALRVMSDIYSYLAARSSGSG